jgi:RNA polymerase sigma-70 factor, ECF subfamily
MPGKSDSMRHLDDSVIKHMDGLYTYALMLSHNRSDAEDLVQETYVRAIPAMGRLRGRSNVKSWLFTILRNIWRNQLRERRSTPVAPEIDIEQYFTNSTAGDTEDPHSLLISKMHRRQVRNAIQQLPIDFREVILLREYEGLSYQEIATILDCPTGTVMSRLGRARSRLRKLLSASRQPPGSLARKQLD